MRIHGCMPNSPQLSLNHISIFIESNRYFVRRMHLYSGVVQELPRALLTKSPVSSSMLSQYSMHACASLAIQNLSCRPVDPARASSDRSLQVYEGSLISSVGKYGLSRDIGYVGSPQSSGACWTYVTLGDPVCELSEARQ